MTEVPIIKKPDGFQYDRTSVMKELKIGLREYTIRALAKRIT